MNLTKTSEVETFIARGIVPTMSAGPVDERQGVRPEEAGQSEIKPKAEIAPLKTPAQKALGASGGSVKKTSFTLDRDLHRQLKILAVQNNRKLQELFNDAILSYIKKHSVA